MASNSSALVDSAPTPEAGTNALRDIKAPVPIPDGWLWFWGIVAAVVVATMAWFLWRRWRQMQAKASAIPPVPPHERARAKLREALAIISQPRPFSILVSDTVRLYLEERFDFRAPERTTEEFLYELQSTPLLTPDQKQSLGDFLERCDLVKFARYEPTHEELQELYNSATRLVDETTPAQMAFDASSVRNEPTQ